MVFFLKRLEPHRSFSCSGLTKETIEVDIVSFQLLRCSFRDKETTHHLIKLLVTLQQKSYESFSCWNSERIEEQSRKQANEY